MEKDSQTHVRCFNSDFYFCPQPAELPPRAKPMLGKRNKRLDGNDAPEKFIDRRSGNKT